TDREVEIVDLICQGISPANISKILHIATSTTYKHIAHIYEKFHVSSRQELLVKLLNQST
ncbi:MAG: DNA-binding response regulator, partial [Clostridia bacterium]|nr:DNA-binding response regulator [Clostridia bacterium]